MTLEQRDRLRLILAIVIVVVVGLVMLLRLRFAPVLTQLAAKQVDNQASKAINDAIQEQIENGDISYDRMVTVEKDAQGNVTAIQSNVGSINRMKTMILNRVDEKLQDMSIEKLGIPFGSVFLPELFSGKGPEISVRVLAVRTSDAVFHNSFTAAGINQTLHRITIDINVTITFLSLSGTEDVEVDSSVIAAETIIVGRVPSTYIGVDGLEEVLP